MTRLRTVSLDELPSIPKLLARAVFPRRSRPDASAGAPGTAYEVKGFCTDLARLAAYDRVCGLPLRDRLPATWLHVLTFPLQMAVMAGADFPFGLTRTLHASNEMTLLRPVDLAEPLDLRVECSAMGPHPKGTAFDLAGQVSVGGEVVWRGTSTYLASAPWSGPTDGVTAPEVLRLDAPDATPSQVWRLPSDLGRRYAAVSGDVNPIHLSPLSARLLGMKRPIIHGMWTHARALAALDAHLPETYTARAQFVKPLALPGKAVLSVDDEGRRFVVASSDGTKPYLIGEIGR